MRILIIAPANDLQVLAELIAAAGENRPTVLHGLVTHREVLAALRSQTYEIIHFAGHGESMRLELSDGPLSTEMLASALDRRQPALVFLNACKSLPAAAALHSHGVGYVIGWRDRVADGVAAEFAVAFYNTLKLNDSPRRSFSTALAVLAEFHPGDEPPVILNGRLLDMQREMEELRTQIGHLRNGESWYWRVGTLAAGGLALAALALAVWR